MDDAPDVDVAKILVQCLLRQTSDEWQYGYHLESNMADIAEKKLRLSLTDLEQQHLSNGNEITAILRSALSWVLRRTSGTRSQIRSDGRWGIILTESMDLATKSYKYFKSADQGCGNTEIVEQLTDALGSWSECRSGLADKQESDEAAISRRRIT